MMSADLFVIIAALSSFLTFVLIQFAVLRQVKPEGLLKALVFMFSVVLTCELICIGVAWYANILGLATFSWVLITAASIGLYGLMAFNFVLCVFGPYETSVRMRLVREISDSKGGISAKDLSERYNEDVIIGIRMRRLLGSGDIVKRQDRYHSREQKNIFGILNQMARVLKRGIES